MAKINPATPIADIHGALQRGDKVVYRVRDGVQQAYIVKRPYEGKPTEAQTASRQSFKNLTQQVKAIYADSAQLAEWQTRFEAYTATRAYKSQLNRYLREQRERSLANPLSTFHFRPTAKRTPKPPTTLYGFILSALANDAKPSGTQENA